MSVQTFKSYACSRCGYKEEQRTNHYLPTYSWGHVNCCPKCPPWAKYAEFGGSTVWLCLELPVIQPDILSDIKLLDELFVNATEEEKRAYGRNHHS